MTDEPQQRVVCSAVRFHLGADHVVICGPRHFDSTMHDAIRRLDPVLWSLRDRNVEEQGFVDQWGTFLTRETAWTIANNAGQIIKEVGGNNLGSLYSENLY